MLRKRARSIQKDQQQMGQITSDGYSEPQLQSDLTLQRQKTNSFFDIPGLFVGLSPQSVSDCDSVKSPTSPLDFKLFSNLGSSIRFPKPSQDGHQKCWDCGKVGLCSIVDCLDEDHRNLPGKTIPSSNSKNVLFGLQVRSKARFCDSPKSLPKNYAIFGHDKMRMRSCNVQKGSSDVLFEIGGNPLETDPYGKIQSFSLDSKRLGSEIYRLKTHNVADLNINVRTNNPCLENETVNGMRGSFSAENRLTIGPMPINYGNEFARPLTPREIELSEDYTCVISHGPNPKTTHIFGDCVLKCHPNEVNCGNKSESFEAGKSGLEMPLSSPYPSNDFLSCCYFCKKKLEDGKDIYMYRGEKAFCSWDCRLEEISIEEEKEKEKSVSEDPRASSLEPEIGDEIFGKSIFTVI